MSESKKVFKPWAPEWLIRITLFLVVLPGLILFVLSISNNNAAAGYYGVSPNDIQYSFIIFYAAMASFVVLEARFFKNVASKEYLIISVILLMLTCLICYSVRNFAIILICRYIQGLITCCTLNITATLMFSRLHSGRAREIAYSVIYGILLSAIPFSTFATSAIIDTFNFNAIYKVAIYSYIPGAALMYVLMNNVRLNRKFPLYQLDWSSFLMYTTGFCLVGYIAVYAQEYDWFEDITIQIAAFLVLVLIILFIIRQRNLKRPYIYLSVFKRKNFVVGALLLFIFYICRGSFGIMTSIMGSVWGLDPIHIGYLLVYNVAAIILAAIVSSKLILTKKPMRLIFIYGFFILLIFHIVMCFMFTTQVDAEDLIIPVILQGFGAGMLMTPIIVFLVSSSPAKFGNTGSAVGILIRFSGFCSSIALINFFQLYRQNDHFNRYQDQLSSLSLITSDRLLAIKNVMIAKGVAPDQASKMSYTILNKGLAAQTQLRFALDYYQILSWVILAVLLLIILFPSINSTIINLKSKRPAPIAY